MKVCYISNDSMRCFIYCLLLVLELQLFGCLIYFLSPFPQIIFINFVDAHFSFVFIESEL